MTSRLIPVVFGIVCCCGPGAQAQIVVTPFVSVNLRTAPGFIDLDDAARDLHGGFGVAVSMVTDGWLGAEGEMALTPSAFSGHDLVTSSRLLTASGGVLAIDHAGSMGMGGATVCLARSGRRAHRERRRR